MKEKAQVTLEFTMIFVIVIMLLFGLLSLWKWSADNIVKRQMAYNSTRTQAGSNFSNDLIKPYSAPEITNNQVDYLE